MIKNILVTVDGSEHSGKALLFISSYKIDEELRDFTTHEYSLKDDSAVTAVSEQMGKNTITQMINKLKTNVVIRTVVLFGNPADRIVEYSMNNNFDMVVMGNRGLSDIKGMMMGSVSRKVSRQVKCTFVSIK